MREPTSSETKALAEYLIHQIKGGRLINDFVTVEHSLTGPIMVDTEWFTSREPITGNQAVHVASMLKPGVTNPNALPGDYRNLALDELIKEIEGISVYYEPDYRPATPSQMASLNRLQTKLNRAVVMDAPEEVLQSIRSEIVDRMERNMDSRSRLFDMILGRKSYQIGKSKPVRIPASMAAPRNLDLSMSSRIMRMAPKGSLLGLLLLLGLASQMGKSEES